LASFITFYAALLKIMLALSKITPSTKQKYSYMQERIKIAQQSKIQIKLENIASRLTQNIIRATSFVLI
jgi:CBS domain containing-hemolysin-like protein